MKRAWIMCLFLTACRALGAEPIDVDREIRIAERMQQETAALTRENAEQLLGLLQGYRFNALADEKTLDAITTIHTQLSTLADPNAAADATNMPGVVALLLKARGAEAIPDKRAALLAAGLRQADVVTTLERLVAIARARLGGLSASRTIKTLIEEQQAIKADTAGLTTETLGLAVDALDEDLRTDLATIARTQEGLRGDLADTLTGLATHATDVAPFQPDYAVLVRRAIAYVADENGTGLMTSASRHVAANQLLEAGREQTRILNVLRKVLAILDEELDVLVIAASSSAATSIGSGPAAGSIDGVFPDLPPFEITADEAAEEYIPGIGKVPPVKGGADNGMAGWMVGLPEKDRQTLTSATGENFPNKYRELLKAYYRALAGGEEASE